MTRSVKRIIFIAVDIFLVLLLLLLLPRAFVVGTQSGREKTVSSLEESVHGFGGSGEGYDVIIVLGAGVWGNSPSPILKYRLDTAVELWNRDLAKKVLVTGDYRKDGYNEVDVMADYLIARGVPSDLIDRDYRGYSTYESIYNAVFEYQYHKAVIVTQQYHLYRALYIADNYGVQAVGVPARNARDFPGVLLRTVREWFACVKDINYCSQNKEP